MGEVLHIGDHHLRILSIRPEAGTSMCARFDLEVTPHLRIFNLVLRRISGGQYRSYAPNACGKHSASFHPDLAEKITTAAVAALQERAANERNTV